MKKGKKLFVANWKMNPVTFAEAREIFLKTRSAVKANPKIEAVVCPPIIFLDRLVALAKGVKRLSLGVQDVFWEKSGAFTGEISSPMVVGLGGQYVILGHSERRKLGETDSEVNRKVLASLASDLRVILCIGENLRDNEGHYLAFLREQIRHGLHRVSKADLGNIIIAYEPIWAIGQEAQSAIKPSDLHEIAILIQKVLAEIYDRKSLENVRLLYGGSVTAQNAHALVFEGEVDGLLVGRESRNPKSLTEIFKAIS